MIDNIYNYNIQYYKYQLYMFWVTPRYHLCFFFFADHSSENRHAFFRKVYFVENHICVIRYDYVYAWKHQIDGKHNSMQNGGRISSCALI